MKLLFIFISPTNEIVCVGERGGLLDFVLVLTIFNEGAYLTFKSIFHKAVNLF